MQIRSLLLPVLLLVGANLVGETNQGCSGGVCSLKRAQPVRTVKPAARPQSCTTCVVRTPQRTQKPAKRSARRKHTQRRASRSSCNSKACRTKRVTARPVQAKPAQQPVVAPKAQKSGVHPIAAKALWFALNNKKAIVPPQSVQCPFAQQRLAAQKSANTCKASNSCKIGSAIAAKYSR